MYVMSQFKSLEKNIGRKKQSTKPFSQFNLGMLIWAPPQHPKCRKIFQRWPDAFLASSNFVVLPYIEEKKMCLTEISYSYHVLHLSTTNT